MAVRGIFSYWLLPVISSLVWLGTLLGLLLHWLIDTDRRRYPTMKKNHNTPYISDIGAQELKPLFVTGAVITAVTFNLSFFAERWLRHRGRLARNQSTGEKALVWLSIFFALVGGAGLILLAAFDSWRYNTLHHLFLVLFVGGYLISAIFTCWEYQRLGTKYRQHRILRSSFWIKLAFIIVEFVLVVVFGAMRATHHRSIGVILEWTISFIFTFYVASFIIDLRPAIHTRDPSMRFEKQHLEDGHCSPENYATAVNGSAPREPPTVADKNAANF